MAYVSPVTADNQELRQCLAHFFPLYSYASLANQSRMRSVSKSTQNHWVSSLNYWVHLDFYTSVWFGDEGAQRTGRRPRDDYTVSIWTTLDRLDKSAEGSWRASNLLPSRVSNAQIMFIAADVPRTIQPQDLMWTLLYAYSDLYMNRNVTVCVILDIIFLSFNGTTM